MQRSDRLAGNAGYAGRRVAVVVAMHDARVLATLPGATVMQLAHEQAAA
jgi:hypothetical protein